MKRPDRKDWNKTYLYYKGDKAALKEHYGVDLRSVYNWIHYYEENIEITTNEIVSEVESDVDKFELLSHKEYVNLQLESPNKPDIRNCNISVPRSCLVLTLADYHCGSKYTDSVLADEIKDICATTPDVYAFFDGDLLDYEGSGPDDIRYDQVFSHPTITRNMAESWIKEFNGSMLLMVTGCHDNWVYRHTGETFVERLSKYIPTNAVFHDSIFLNFKVGNVIYSGHVAHKAGRGTSKFNPSHGGFQELREDFDGDFVISAHTHTPGIAMQLIRDKPCMVVNCDSFKTVDFFANKKYVPKPIHINAVYFDGENKRMVPFFDWRDGLRYIKKLKLQQENKEQLKLVT